MADLGFGDLPGDQEGVLVDDRRHLVADVDEVAELDRPGLQARRERRADLGMVEPDPGLLERRLGGLQIGRGLRHLGLRLEPLAPS